MRAALLGIAMVIGVALIALGQNAEMPDAVRTVCSFAGGGAVASVTTLLARRS